jgi:hypothetical protein
MGGLDARPARGQERSAGAVGAGGAPAIREAHITRRHAPAVTGSDPATADTVTDPAIASAGFSFARPKVQPLRTGAGQHDVCRA